MDGKKYLGIYLSKSSATVTCLALHGRECNVVDCFTVYIQDRQADILDISDTAAELAGLIAKECAQKSLPYQDCEAAVALDCSMFMQHNIRSNFIDQKQIAQTVRFDTEETLTTDIGNTALAFEVHSKSQTASELVVFTAQKKILQDILSALQKNNIDPIIIEPDINCLSRFITKYLPSEQNQNTVCAILSNSNGYFIVPSPGTGKTPVKRTFLISPSQNRNELLIGQIALTIAKIDDAQKSLSLKVFDAANMLDTQFIAEKLGCQIQSIDLTELLASEEKSFSDCEDKVAFAAAFGAAASFSDKSQIVDFRGDFSPFEGTKQKIRKNIKIISVSAIVCMLALGIYFQKQLAEANVPRKEIRAVFEKDYLAVLPGSKKLPPKFAEAIRNLEKERNRLRRYKKGSIGEGESSVPAKLTLVLEAFNQCAKKTDLQINSINVTAKSIRLTGSTSNPKNTLELRKALNDVNLNISTEKLIPEGGRHNFTITIDTQ